MFTRGSLDVTYSDLDRTRIPDLLQEAAATLVDLGDRETIKQVGKRLKIRRQGGFCGLDVWVLLLVYMTTGASQGVRKFWELIRPHKVAFGALAGRKKLASPASLSRALAAVEVDLLREQSMWLLAGAPGIDAVLGHPGVKTYDACGRGWHVFDIDPTVTTHRHRSLPAGEDLPEPRRDSENTGAPGHMGRKRGDIVHRRITAEHAGSSLWVHAHLSAGNGEGVIDLERALDSVGETCDRLGHPRARALVRMDGEFGNVPWFTACRERGLPFITRLNRPNLYEDPTVLKRLRTATWFRVPDSGSGPKRSAADLGFLTIRPGKKTRRADGSTYAPIKVRVVVSIFPKSRKAKRGRNLDGWQVELFAADVDVEGWPAPEVVASYFARTGQENRFAQEDREIGLDRIVSYHLPGQELASVVGLSVWNLRVARGFELEPPPVVLPRQCLRHPERDPRVADLWPRDPVVVDLLATLDFDALLQKRSGWSFRASTGELWCEDGRPLALTTVRPSESAPGRTCIIFRRPMSGCSACDYRPRCLTSCDPLVAKHIELSVPTEVASLLRDRLALVRGKTPEKKPTTIEPVPGRAGFRCIVDPLFLPARARQRFRQIFQRATLHVEVLLPRPSSPQPRLVAASKEDRQRRRCTWQMNVDRYALPPRAVIRLHVAGSPELRQMFGESRQAKATG